jgi:hypothetical protein
MIGLFCFLQATRFTLRRIRVIDLDVAQSAISFQEAEGGYGCSPVFLCAIAETQARQ